MDDMELLQMMISGDRAGAEAKIKELLNAKVHEFLFPEDNEVHDDLDDFDLGDDTSAVEVLPSDQDVETTPDPAADVGGDDLDMDLDFDYTDTAAELGGEGESGEEGDLLDDDMLFAPDQDEDAEPALGESFEREEDDGQSTPEPDPIGDIDNTDVDADLDNLSQDLEGVTADDVTGVEELPPGGDERPAVVDVYVDPEQLDRALDTVVVKYEDETEETFKVLKSDSDSIISLLKDMCCPAEADDGALTDPSMSVDTALNDLSESYVIFR